jgi:hypothetical protein
MTREQKLAAGTGSSIRVERCQVCESPCLQPILFLGYLPPVNQMRLVGDQPQEQPAYPAQWLYCPRCQLVQLGLIVDPHILFPPTYPYTSGTTKVLRDNFADLYRECLAMVPLTSDDLIVDIGSNDGTLLRNFKEGGHQVLGIEPTLVGNLAKRQGIHTELAFFTRELATKVRSSYGKVRMVTATNVLAHMENIHDCLDGILELLRHDGVFISESHYLFSLLETLQYDTIYHEHLRYYSLASLQYLLRLHHLEVIHAKRIPTHGGSIRVYAARTDTFPVQPSVRAILNEEASWGPITKRLDEFKRQVVLSKLRLHALLLDLKQRGHRIYGIGAPSRASTLINYVGLDDGILECVLEVKGSQKIGKYVPGTVIPVLEESRLFEEQPEYAMLLSWHLADELIPKLTRRGFRGDYIVPLPIPKVVEKR